MTAAMESAGSAAPGHHEPGDLAGKEILEAMRSAPRYNAWQARRIAPFLGRRVCEVGSGIGNMSDLLWAGGMDQLVLTDTDSYYRHIVSRRFAERPSCAVEELTLPDPAAGRRFARYDLDTVVALNVLEHIPDDLSALASMHQMLARGGRAIVLVPALPILYGSLDNELGHVRRYRRDGLRAVMEAAGFRLLHLSYFNLLGTAGWLWNARIRRVVRFPLRQVRWFDALVPLLRAEDHVRLPFGQSLIAVGQRSA